MRYPLTIIYLLPALFLTAAFVVKVSSNSVSPVKKQYQHVSAPKLESSFSATLKKAGYPEISQSILIKTSPTAVPATPTVVQRVDLNSNSSVKIESVSPSDVLQNQQITLRGSSFGPNPGSVWVYNEQGGGLGGPRIDSWSDTEIKTALYMVSGSGTLYLEVKTRDGIKSNKIPIRLVAGQPIIGSVNPTTFVRGAQVTISGTGFGQSGNVKFYSASDKAWDNFIADGITNSWSDSEIKFTVPNSLDAKEYGIEIHTSDNRTSSFKYFKVE